MKFFQSYQPVSASMPFLRGCCDNEEYDLNDHMPVDINLNTMLDLRNSKSRMNEVAVMIVDYNMPGKTGIEMSRELKNLPVKKILLTGDANHQLAINAFNEGIIHGFIRKDEPTLAEDLLSHIKKLNHLYFSEVSKHLLSHLEMDYHLPQSDSVFVKFFTEWCIQNEIVEHYVIDKNGTLLVINKDGQAQYFLIHTNRSLDLFTDTYAEDLETKAFVQSILSRKKIPFFGFKKEPWHYEVSQWKNFLYVPQILIGKETYYWATISDDYFQTT